MTNYWYYVDGSGSIDCIESKKKARLECIKAIRKFPKMRYNIICTNSNQMKDTCIERIYRADGIWYTSVFKKSTRRGGYAEIYEIRKDGSLGPKIGNQDW